MRIGSHWRLKQKVKWWWSHARSRGQQKPLWQQHAFWFFGKVLHILPGRSFWVDDFPTFPLGWSLEGQPIFPLPSHRQVMDGITQLEGQMVGGHGMIKRRARGIFEPLNNSWLVVNLSTTFNVTPLRNEGLYNKALLKGKPWVSQARKIRPAISGGAYVRRGIRLRSHHLAFLAWWKRPIQISHGDHLFDVLLFTCFIGTKGLKRWLTWKTR